MVKQDNRYIEFLNSPDNNLLTSIVFSKGLALVTNVADANAFLKTIFVSI